MTNSRVHIIFGPPGTGKTTRLVGLVKEYIDSGVDPERIGFMSFSKQAARVAIEKMTATPPDGLGIPKQKLKYFCTLHSIAYRLLKLGRKDVVNWRHYNEIGDMGGYAFDEAEDRPDEKIDVQRIGVRCRQIYALSRARMTDVETEWRRQNHRDLQLETVQKFVSVYEQYKESQLLLDFQDMLTRADPSNLDLEILVLDEAQDLTAAQWSFASKVGKKCRKVIIAGDDDQCIFAWNGANSGPLREFIGEREYLPQSHRLPQKIYALANKIVVNIKDRVPKEFKPRNEPGGIYRLSQPEEVDLSKGEWLLLTRCRYGLEIWEKIAKQQNVVYFSNKEWSNNNKEVRVVIAWTKFTRGEQLTKSELQLIAQYRKPEATTEMNWMEALAMDTESIEYIRGLKRRGEKLKGPGRVTISTIHSAKGCESENVALLLDTNRNIARNWLTSETANDEYRVLYVGLTRARENLYLVRPTRTNFYAI